MIIKYLVFTIFLLNKNKTYYFILIALIFLAVFYDPILSIDYYNYDKSLRLEQIERWEPLFQLIGFVAIFFESSLRINIFYLITVTFSLIVIKETIKLFEVDYDKFYFIVLLLIFPKGFFWIFNLPRQFFAVFLTFFAIKCLKKKNDKMSYLFFVMASLTHISSIIFISLYIFFNKINFQKLYKRKFLIITILIVMGYNLDLIHDFIIQKTQPRLDMVPFLDKSGKNYLYFLALLSSFILLAKKNKQWLFFNFFLLVILYSFEFFGQTVARLSYFLVPFLVYDLVKILNKINTLSFKIIIKSIVFIICLALNIYIAGN